MYDCHWQSSIFMIRCAEHHPRRQPAMMYLLAISAMNIFGITIYGYKLALAERPWPFPTEPPSHWHEILWISCWRAIHESPLRYGFSDTEIFSKSFPFSEKVLQKPDQNGAKSSKYFEFWGAFFTIDHLKKRPFSKRKPGKLPRSVQKPPKIIKIWIFHEYISF